MQAIELDQEFFDSVKSDKREDVVNGIVNNVMSGQYEYACVGENWNLQDFVNEALGDDEVCKQIAYATSRISSINSSEAIYRVSIVAREKLAAYVQSFCNQNDVGIA
mgnify:CR=1 FL=1